MKKKNKRIVVLVLTAPIWIPVFLFLGFIMFVMEVMRYGFKGEFDKNWWKNPF